MRVGVDTGGTFTDCVVFDGAEARILKVFSTAGDPARGILEGVRGLAQSIRSAAGRAASSKPLDIIHGTTIGTNSLLERKGARVALVTTAGFEDLIEIGRQNRPRLYDFNVRREEPLVPRHLRWGVRERTVAGGKRLLKPAGRELRRLASEIHRSGAESIAICFLFSFANPENERSAGRALRALRLPLSISHEILPEFREYERLSTVVINAFLAPRFGQYLATLERQLSSARVFVMQSSGGISTAARAACEPVRTIFSGPAGGVVATGRLSEILEIDRAISFDMGGTSTDVCLLDGPPRTTHETTLAGLPVAVPVLDVHSVGAGGGSIARLDAGGALRVGPESAGVRPGPACYGHGGKQPTVTDAHLILGRLDARNFLGGTFQLQGQRALETFSQFLARRDRKLRALSSGLQTPLDLARGIVAVSNATVERALRVITVERGHDPRDFTLVSFGGAGGLHAADLARSLGFKQIVVPPNPGAFSALGILLSDIVKDISQSVLLPVPSNARGAQFRNFYSTLERKFERLEEKGRAELRQEGSSDKTARAERRLDVRYVGQAYELSVPFSADFESGFHQEHEKSYSYAHPARPLEIVNLRVRLVARTPRPRPARYRPTRRVNLRQALVTVRPVWFDRQFRKTPWYDRTRLAPGARFRGPAVVAEYSSTTVVPPDFVCRVDEHGNLILSL